MPLAQAPAAAVGAAIVDANLKKGDWISIKTLIARRDLRFKHMQGRCGKIRSIRKKNKKKCAFIVFDNGETCTKVPSSIVKQVEVDEPADADVKLFATVESKIHADMYGLISDITDAAVGIFGVKWFDSTTPVNVSRADIKITQIEAVDPIVT